MDDNALFASLRHKLFTAVVGDVLYKMGCRRQFLPQAIGPLRPDVKLVGPAKDPAIVSGERNLVGAAPLVYSKRSGGSP